METSSRASLLAVLLLALTIAPAADARQTATLRVTARVVDHCTVTTPSGNVLPDRANAKGKALVDQDCHGTGKGKVGQSRHPADHLHPPAHSSQKILRKYVQDHGKRESEVVLLTVTY